MSNVQFIKTPEGGELAVLSRSDYEALVAAAREAEEDAADIAAYDAAKAADPIMRRALPAEITAAMLKGDSLLRALRKNAGLTQAELASRAGIGQGYLSEIEVVDSRKSPSTETLIALAKALGVDQDWLIAMKG
jgi:DNA-binding XRE family transcriptional regulator